jgi:hypothetical protein
MQCSKEFVANKKHTGRKRPFCSFACCAAWKAVNGNPDRRNPIGHISKYGGYNVIKIGQPNKRIAEHRFIAEQKLGRKLKPAERVHHVNGIKSDNRPENLRICANTAEHSRIHHEAERIGLAVMASDAWIPTAEGMGC